VERQASYLDSSSVNTLLGSSGVTYDNRSVSSGKVVANGTCTTFLIYPPPPAPQKKSNGVVRSGERDGHAVRPPLPIHSVKICLIYLILSS
jgi:hypothetical protein